MAACRLTQHQLGHLVLMGYLYERWRYRTARAITSAPTILGEERMFFQPMMRRHDT